MKVSIRRLLTIAGLFAIYTQLVSCNIGNAITVIIPKQWKNKEILMVSVDGITIFNGLVMDYDKNEEVIINYKTEKTTFLMGAYLSQSELAPIMLKKIFVKDDMEIIVPGWVESREMIYVKGEAKTDHSECKALYNRSDPQKWKYIALHNKHIRSDIALYRAYLDYEKKDGWEWEYMVQKCGDVVLVAQETNCQGDAGGKFTGIYTVEGVMREISYGFICGYE